MTKTIVPFHDYIVFERIDADKTPSGLHVPQTAESHIKCLVVAVGDGLINPTTSMRCKPQVEVGDMILIRTSATVSIIEHTGKALYMVASGDVIGKVVEEKYKLESIA